MIITVEGKKLVFEMTWRSMLSQVHVHKEAANAKSKYLWHGEKEVYFGLIGKNDQGAKLKGPMYSAAIALIHLHHQIQNILLVLAVPGGEGYLACGIHQGRPYDTHDVFLKDETHVSFLLESFESLCGGDSFTVMGDAPLRGIVPLSFEELAGAADSHAQLKKVKSQLLNPLAMLVGVACVGAIGVAGYQAYAKHRDEEMQKKAMAAQKNSQQMYDAELAERRKDTVLPARAAPDILRTVESLKPSKGGWTLKSMICNVAQTKQMACALVYDRGGHRQATYKSFVDDVGPQFLTTKFAGDKIEATMTIDGQGYSTAGTSIDAAVISKQNEVEFMSMLQQFSTLGKQVIQPFEPFAIPPGANVAELTKPPGLWASWEFNGPLKGIELLRRFPHSATVSQIDIQFTDKISSDVPTSFAMMKVSGKLFAKQT